MNKNKKEAVTIIPLLLLLCFFIYYVSFRPWIIASNTVNDVSKYNKYIRLYKKSLTSSSRIRVDNHDKLPLGHSYPPDNFPDIKEDFKIGYLEKLPDDFEIYLYETDMEKLGNHGFVAFTAISLDKNEVLYYAESW